MLPKDAASINSVKPFKWEETSSAPGLKGTPDGNHSANFLFDAVDIVAGKVTGKAEDLMRSDPGKLSQRESEYLGMLGYEQRPATQGRFDSRWVHSDIDPLWPGWPRDSPSPGQIVTAFVITTAIGGADLLRAMFRGGR